VLLVTLRHVGVSDVEVSWAEVLAVFAFARLATAIPLTPGGATCWSTPSGWSARSR
jgi:putative heme transporter